MPWNLPLPRGWKRRVRSFVLHIPGIATRLESARADRAGQAETHAGGGRCGRACFEGHFTLP